MLELVLMLEHQWQHGSPRGPLPYSLVLLNVTAYNTLDLAKVTESMKRGVVERVTCVS